MDLSKNKKERERKKDKRGQTSLDKTKEEQEKKGLDPNQIGQKTKEIKKKEQKSQKRGSILEKLEPSIVVPV